MSDTVEAKVTHRFAASPERVYDTFLDPDRVRDWQAAWLRHGGMGGDVTASELNPIVGGTFLFADKREDGEARHWGMFLDLERPTRIAFTWIVDESEEDDPSEVTLIIEPEPDGPGAIATLYHAMDAQWADYVPQTEKGWQAMLEGLDSVL
ncbi:SRPBCC domain-containing protein [Devosia ginsengisoli]|uniref:SRPBCC family protein n=1 Tax=Devosia ginsengisoli TaxID=400770 RepID=UPI0026F25E75|nr:SRPBCC family protein [Devosia ginsengisoli]MCR6671210.1 SRPBCC domain-containing protein [Devosia ginsengisoli]